MTILDDTVLALIARFVVDDLENLSISDEHFLQQQIQEIKNHVQGIPREQQQKIILEWIEEHAERYRQQWQKKAITQLLENERCSDCPLIGYSTTHCAIHEKWIGLLTDYLAGKVDSIEYVEKSLHLLARHKQELKIKHVLT